MAQSNVGSDFTYVQDPSGLVFVIEVCVRRILGRAIQCRPTPYSTPRIRLLYGRRQLSNQRHPFHDRDPQPIFIRYARTTGLAFVLVDDRFIVTGVIGD